jgi:pyruvate ferredoxin oxidoreductase delta subunit
MIVKESDIKYDGVKGIPHIREAGNAIRHRTGNWRVFKPFINYKKCISCKLCFTFCPDSAILWKRTKEKEFPQYDYDICKGCMLCKEICPVKAISAELDRKEDKK